MTTRAKAKILAVIATAIVVLTGIGAAVNLHGNTINADTGYQIGAAAPSGHTLCGNGTDYVDSAAACGTPATSITGQLTLAPFGPIGSNSCATVGPVTMSAAVPTGAVVTESLAQGSSLTQAGLQLFIFGVSGSTVDVQMCNSWVVSESETTTRVYNFVVVQ